MATNGIRGRNGRIVGNPSVKSIQGRFAHYPTAPGRELYRHPYELSVDCGQVIRSHTVVIASGAEYKKSKLENLTKFEGQGVYYGATYIEAQLSGKVDAIVVGGGAQDQGRIFAEGDLDIHPGSLPELECLEDCVESNQIAQHPQIGNSLVAVQAPKGSA